MKNKVFFGFLLLCFFLNKKANLNFSALETLKIRNYMWDSFQPKVATRYMRDVKSLPFEELEDATRATYSDLVAEFDQKYGLEHKSWVYPQLLAEVATWGYTRASDKIDTKDFLARNCKNSSRNRGIYWFLMWDSRALSKQYLSTEFCALTPLIMSAFKKMHNIKYSEWSDPQLVMPPGLYKAATAEYPEYSSSELLEFREQGLIVQSGKRVGVARAPDSSYALNGYPRELEDGRPSLGALPQLTRMMLCQTWCAHPKHRSKYSILDPKDWDSMPEPLVDETPLSDPKPSKTPELDVPW